MKLLGNLFSGHAVLADGLEYLFLGGEFLKHFCNLLISFDGLIIAQVLLFVNNFFSAL